MASVATASTNATTLRQLPQSPHKHLISRSRDLRSGSCSRPPKEAARAFSLVQSRFAFTHHVLGKKLEQRSDRALMLRCFSGPPVARQSNRLVAEFRRENRRNSMRLFLDDSHLRKHDRPIPTSRRSSCSDVVSHFHIDRGFNSSSLDTLRFTALHAMNSKQVSDEPTRHPFQSK